MQIIIEYEASWRNSFLDGSNNEELPPKGKGRKIGRNFIGSIQALGKNTNFKYQPISKDTIMGILNRLIGEQRKLYQARQAPDYYFKTIEPVLTEEDIKDNAIITQELIFIRNMSGNTDQNSFTGMIKSNDPAFNSDFSPQLWGILFLSLDEVIQFILNEDFQFTPSLPALDPIVIINRLEGLNKIKPIKLSEESQKAFDHIQNRFSSTVFKLTTKELFILISFYASALYIQISRLQNQHALTHILTKQGNISGISKRGFTKKDFMDTYTTGEKKLIWGNPYILKEKKKGEGEVVQSLTKASGRLAITLNIPKEQARDLEQKIEDAGVSSFYIGKKGLAYVTDIRI
ncbi:type I-Fv CRISPR-associated protein Cas5fv [Arsenophonus sp. PmNCSU2021_1]|uniref:type I-Fv CRISPR-associated protein Cas5fv n=1 Tax=Arsenophonus sp. PmNCSU2021_1 TaxID=3118989 RepID=UPI002FEF9596